MAEAETKVLNELRAIRKNLDYIKDRMEVMFLSKDDEAALDEAEHEYLAGKSVSLADFKKQMGD